jgi:hypothetical protein
MLAKKLMGAGGAGGAGGATAGRGRIGLRFWVGLVLTWRWRSQ